MIKYQRIFSGYGADTKLHLKQSRRNNSESMKARVAILVRDTSSKPVLHNYIKYHDKIPKGSLVLHLKPSRGNNSESMNARVVILVRDTSS